MINIAKLIQNLWILLRTGTVLFDRVIDKSVDVHLFGAMLSALDTFAYEMSGKNINSFELKDINMSIIETNDVRFIATYAYFHRDYYILYPYNNWILIFLLLI